MKNKKLLITLAIVVAVAVVLILLFTLFNISTVNFVYYSSDNKAIATPADAPTTQELLSVYRGKSILLTSSNTLANLFNTNFTDFHAFEIIRSFPNSITIHIVRRTAAISITYGSQTVYLDVYGYVVPNAPEYETLDVTEAFITSLSSATFEAGKKLQFESQTDNNRLSMVLQTVNAIWMLKYGYSDVASILSGITFNEVANQMLLQTSAGATIKVEQPDQNLYQRLIDAFSVYFNESLDLQKPGVVITVTSQGKIITQR